MNCYDKLLNISTKLKDKRMISWVSGNIGVIYTNQGKFAKAMKYFEKQISICEELGDKKGISIAEVNIGDIFNNQANHSEALRYYEKAISIGRELELNYFLCNYLYKKAKLLFELDIAKAYSLNREALKIAIKVSNRGIVFRAKVLEKKINFQSNISNQSKLKVIVENMEYMLNNENRDENIAVLNYELCKMKKEFFTRPTTAIKKNRDLSLQAYRKLYKKVPKVDYKNKIDELKEMNIE